MTGEGLRLCRAPGYRGDVVEGLDSRGGLLLGFELLFVVVDVTDLVRKLPSKVQISRLASTLVREEARNSGQITMLFRPLERFKIFFAKSRTWLIKFVWPTSSRAVFVVI